MVNFLGQPTVSDRGILSSSFILIEDQKASGTSGGTFTSGDWRTRDLNTVVSDDDNILVSLSSNQFTLPAGTYLLEANAPAYNVLRHSVRLYNVTGASVAAEGQCSYSHNTSGLTSNRADILTKFTISSDTAYRIEHQCETTTATVGFGVNSNYNSVSIFTQVKIIRLYV